MPSKNNGPIPKRSDERVRRNKPEVPIQKVQAFGMVEPPDLGIPDAHPFVTDFYESLKDSAQSRFYEPSDWEYARWVCNAMNDFMKASKPSAMMFQAINSALSDLLITEGERRRVRLEIERGQAGSGESAEVTSIEDYFKRRFGK